MRPYVEDHIHLKPGQIKSDVMEQIGATGHSAVNMCTGQSLKYSFNCPFCTHYVPIAMRGQFPSGIILEFPSSSGYLSLRGGGTTTTGLGGRVAVRGNGHHGLRH